MSCHCGGCFRCIEGPRGPQGPTGPQGPQGDVNDDIGTWTPFITGSTGGTATITVLQADY